ncbi:MAG: methionine biosynthesis protein MetW [Planctomycetaceae bacterium]|nr:methionine biosynthesis protein MetW [Planctomycetaceae bacterium]
MPDPRSALTNEILMRHIDAESRVIDLGCGDGLLLERLRDEHQCQVTGIERDTDLFLAAIERGVPMLQVDLNAELTDLPDRAFDFAVLSQTLQQVSRPLDLLNEIFRIAEKALVVVPNFGHWRIRLQVLLQGRAPVTDSLPYQWYESPNVHFLSMLDFRELAASGNFKIVKELPIIGSSAVDRALLANARAHSVLYVLERPSPS